MKKSRLCLAVILPLFLFVFSWRAEASYDGSLAWIAEGMEEPENAPTVLYGEVQVLVSRKAMYYCPVNWNCTKDEAGGYCGIQDQVDTPRNVRFSVWDTAPKLPASLSAADPRTKAVHSNDEGSVESTKLFYDWKEGEVFRFLLTKKADKSGKNTLVTFYFFDQGKKQWVAEATILSPMDARLPQAKFHGALMAFQEDFSSQKLKLPRVSTYRLWAGYDTETLKFVRTAKIRGRWGVVNGSFCFAGGERSAVDAFLAKQREIKMDVPIHWDWDDKKSGERATVADQPLPKEIAAEIGRLLVEKDEAQHSPAVPAHAQRTDSVGAARFSVMREGEIILSDRSYKVTALPKEMDGTLLLLRLRDDSLSWLESGKASANKDGWLYMAVLSGETDRARVLTYVTDAQFDTLKRAGWSEVAGDFSTTGFAFRWRVMKRRIEKGKVEIENVAKIKDAVLLFMFGEGMAGDQAQGGETKPVAGPPGVAKMISTLAGDPVPVVTTTDGQMFKKVIATKVLDDKVILVHSEGAAAVLLDSLSDEARKSLGLRTRTEQTAFEAAQTRQGLVKVGDDWITPEEKKRREIAARFVKDLNSLVPNWRDVMNDPRFLAWLKEKDANGVTHAAVLRDCQQSGDATAVAGGIRLWWKEQQARDAQAKDDQEIARLQKAADEAQADLERLNAQSGYVTAGPRRRVGRNKWVQTLTPVTAAVGEQLAREQADAARREESDRAARQRADEARAIQDALDRQTREITEAARQQQAQYSRAVENWMRVNLAPDGRPYPWAAPFPVGR